MWMWTRMQAWVRKYGGGRICGSRSRLGRGGENNCVEARVGVGAEANAEVDAGVETGIGVGGGVGTETNAKVNADVKTGSGAGGEGGC